MILNDKIITVGQASLPVNNTVQCDVIDVTVRRAGTPALPVRGNKNTYMWKLMSFGSKLLLVTITLCTLIAGFPISSFAQGKGRVARATCCPCFITILSYVRFGHSY